MRLSRATCTGCVNAICIQRTDCILFKPRARTRTHGLEYSTLLENIIEAAMLEKILLLYALARAGVVSRIGIQCDCVDYMHISFDRRRTYYLLGVPAADFFSSPPKIV